MEHYRCYQLVNPNTRCQCIAETIQFVSHNFEMPQRSLANLAAQATSNLANALHKTHHAAPFLSPKAQLHHNLQQLSHLFSQGAYHHSPLPHMAPLRVSVHRIAASSKITLTGAPRASNPKLASLILTQTAPPAKATNIADSQSLP